MTNEAHLERILTEFSSGLPVPARGLQSLHFPKKVSPPCNSGVGPLAGGGEEFKGSNPVREPSLLGLHGETAGPGRSRWLRGRCRDKDPERSVYIPQQGPEEGEHAHEGDKVADPMLPISGAFFSPHTGLPLRAAHRENLPLLASGEWGSLG